jgi:hypothetical protein
MQEATYHELARLEHAAKANVYARHGMYRKAESHELRAAHHSNFGPRTRSQPEPSARELRALAREERREREHARGVCIAVAYDAVMVTGGTKHRSRCRKATKDESDSEDDVIVARKAMCEVSRSTGRCVLRKPAGRRKRAGAPSRFVDAAFPSVLDEEDAKFQSAMEADPDGPSAFRLARPGRGKVKLPPTGNKVKLGNMREVYRTARDPTLDRMQNISERMDLVMWDPMTVSRGYRPPPIVMRDPMTVSRGYRPPPIEMPTFPAY